MQAALQQKWKKPCKFWSLVLNIKEYIEWITRQNRNLKKQKKGLSAAIEWIEQGKGRNWNIWSSKIFCFSV